MKINVNVANFVMKGTRCVLVGGVIFTVGVFSGDLLFEMANKLTMERRMNLIIKSKEGHILPSKLSFLDKLVVGKLKNDLIARQLEKHIAAYRLSETHNFFQEQDDRLFEKAISKLLEVDDTSWLFSGPNGHKLLIQYFKYVGLEVDHWLSNVKTEDGLSRAVSLLHNFFRHLVGYLKTVHGVHVAIDPDVASLSPETIAAIHALSKVDVLLPIAVCRTFYLLGRRYLGKGNWDVASKCFTIAENLSNTTEKPIPIEAILSRRSGILVCEMQKLEDNAGRLVEVLAGAPAVDMSGKVQKCIESLKSLRKQYATLREDERVFYDIMSDNNMSLRADHIHQAECTNQMVKTLLLELQLHVACRCRGGVDQAMIEIMELLVRSNDDFSLLNGVGRFRGIKRQRLYLVDLAEMLQTISASSEFAAMWPKAATGVLFARDVSSSLWHQELLDQLLQMSPENAARLICEKVIHQSPVSASTSGLRDRATAEAEKILERLQKAKEP